MTYGAERTLDLIRSCVLLLGTCPSGATRLNLRKLLHLRFGTTQISLLMIHLIEYSHSQSWKLISEKCQRNKKNTIGHVVVGFQQKQTQTKKPYQLLV